MNQTVIDFSAPAPAAIAREKAEQGMRRTLSAAERRTPGWGDIAYEFLRDYAKVNERFTGWMVVRSAAERIPEPPNPKAWGSVIQKAARAGVIRKVGTTPDVHRHGNPIPVWESVR
jgi:hypothetical protein